MARESVIVIDTNNIVVDMMVVESQASDEETLTFAQSIVNDNTKTLKLAKNYTNPTPGVNQTYDVDNDRLIPVFEFNSWTFNKTTWEWEPPVAYPADYDASVPTHIWDENEQIWRQWDSVNLTFVE